MHFWTPSFLAATLMVAPTSVALVRGLALCSFHLSLDLSLSTKKPFKFSPLSPEAGTDASKGWRELLKYLHVRASPLLVNQRTIAMEQSSERVILFLILCLQLTREMRI